jgi:hypothetical protein
MLPDTRPRKYPKSEKYQQDGRFVPALSLQELRVRCFDPHALSYAIRSAGKRFTRPLSPTLLARYNDAN